MHIFANKLTYRTMKRYLFTIYLVIWMVLNSCSTKNSETSVQIFAAAGTIQPSNEICDSLATEQHIPVHRNYASSGTLARQIASGAEFDMYISANKKWMDYLQNKDLIDSTSIKVIARNQLVIITSTSNSDFAPEFKHNFDILSSTPNKIAIGDPDYVPVGNYAKQMLEGLGWYNSLQARTILTKDVMTVVKLVEMSEADWGIVYNSEVVQNQNVHVAASIPDTLHKPIEFYIALPKTKNQQAIKLYELYLSSFGQETFTKHGFIK